MASYYQEKQQMYNELTRILTNSSNKNRSFSMDSLIFELTSVFAVPEKAIKERLELMQKTGKIFIKKGTILVSQQK